MTTPIVDFVRSYAERKTLRLHMPGHKGCAQLGVEDLDITEIDGADVLYAARGIIRESEENAARLFGSGRTLYSTEGSSLAIRAMLNLAVLAAKERGVPPRIAAGRNAHKTFTGAAALLDLEVSWLFGEAENLLSCRITPEFLARSLDALDEKGQKPIAVYLTSPDYLGNTLDVRGLAAVCHEREILLLVDNAHGAYLRFLRPSRHPIDLGADACCDSAHKTLPVLTGGAYLHVASRAPRVFFEYAEQSMALFASTSPSYLILQSLDLANRTLAEGYADRLALLADRLDSFKAELRARGFTLVGDEPMKLTVATKSWGYTGEAVAEYLADRLIVCEFADTDFVTMMFTPASNGEEIARLSDAFAELSSLPPIDIHPPVPMPTERACSIREATLSLSEELAIEDCLGRVLASAQLSCPPAIPIVVCGERIDDQAIECMKYYGIEKCRVMKPSEV